MHKSRITNNPFPATVLYESLSHYFCSRFFFFIQCDRVFARVTHGHNAHEHIPENKEAPLETAYGYSVNHSRNTNCTTANFRQTNIFGKDITP